MASTLTFFSILATLSVVVLIDPTVARDYNDHNPNLKKLCLKTNDKELCMSLMSSYALYSQTLDYDYRSLAEVAIDLAYSKAEEIPQEIKYAIDGTTNEDKKELYKSCSKNYCDVVKDLQKTKDLFRDGDYKRIENQIKDATEKVRNCKDQVRRRENSDSSDLDKRNKEFEILCDIIRISAKNWKGDDWDVKKKN